MDIIYFLFLHESMCWYPLEMPQQGAFNDYPIMKTCLFKYIKNVTSKNIKFSDKKNLIFFIFLLKT